MADKIDKLTPEQEAAMDDYVAKWRKIGVDTSRLDPDETVNIIHAYQENILKMKKTPVLIVDNPIEAWVGCNYAVTGVPIDEIKDRIANYFKCAKGEKDIEIDRPVYPYQDGSFFSSILSFYDYMISELGIDIPQDLLDKFEIWKDTSKLGLIYPLDEVCIVTEKPLYIHLNEDNELHRDGGPALAYAGAGEFKIYAMNGISCSDWLVETPAMELDLKRYHDIKNADERTEFVRKFGIERMLGEFGKQLDTFEKYDHEWWTNSEYELWDMNEIFEGVAYAPHLKMKNMSTGVWHVEAVSPKCANLKDAIKERFGGKDFTIAAIA